MSAPQRKDQMHPQDMRNLILFCVLSLLIYLMYDTFILKPQAQALLDAKRAQSTIAATQAPAAGVLPQEKFVTREEALSAGQRVKIDTPEVKGTVLLKGARLDDLALKEFFETLAKKDNVTILSPAGTEHARYIEHGWASADKNVRVPDQDSVWQARAPGVLTRTQPLTLFWDNGAGLVFENTYDIDEHYMITLSQRVINNSGRDVTLFPYGLISQKGMELSKKRSWLQHEGPIGYIGDQLHEVNYADLRKNPRADFEASRGWIGITDKYWLMALMPAQNGDNVKYRFTRSGPLPAKRQPDHGRFQTDFTSAPIAIAAGQSGAVKSHIFAGAKKVLVLERYESSLNIPNFSLAVNFGWFWFLSKPFFYALHYLGELTGNFGVAIILLTIVIRSAVFPLTNASYKSFAKMKKVAPQIAELRENYGSDKPRLQKELVELYSREGVNPMAGCVPILLQIPIFFALYKVLFVTIEMRHAPFFGWIQDLSAPDPTSVFNLFGLIPWDPPAVLHIGVWPCVMLVALILQKKLNPPPQDPIQRDMANYFPFLMTYVMSQFASGLVVYWTFSAYMGLAQQMIIMRSMKVPIYLFSKSASDETIEKSLAKGQSAHPIAEMAEHEIEEALFGDDGDRRRPEDSAKIKPLSPRKKKKKK